MFFKSCLTREEKMSYLELIFHAFITLFVVVNPLGAVPVFSSLNARTSASWKRKMALKAPLVAFLILLFFAFLGNPFLAFMSISIPAFRIGGGLMLFAIAFGMLFKESEEKKIVESDEVKAKDVSVFPIGIPLLAGPGSITAIILLVNNQGGHFFSQFLIICVLVAIMLLVCGMFLLTNKLAKYMTMTVNNVITKVFGIILGALSMQYVIDGVLGVVKSAF